MKPGKFHFAVLSLLILIIGAGYLSYPILGPDSGFYLANAAEMYHGKVYFVDIAIAYNPLAIATLGLPFLFDAHPDPRWSLLINMVIISASAWLLYRILEQLKNDKPTHLLLVLFYILASLMLDGSHLMLEPLSVFFQLLGLTYYLSHKKGGRTGLLLLAGIAFSFSFFSKQYGLFILAPVGLDMLFFKKNVLKKIGMMGLGFLMPVVLFYVYLAQTGLDFVGYLRHIMGMGAKLDVGNGTGINYSTLTYLIGFGVFLAYNLYVGLIPFLLWQIRKSRPLQYNIFPALLVSSLLVLVSASYGHYFLYVLPYALLVIGFLLPHATHTKMPMVTLMASVTIMGAVGIFSIVRKPQKIKLQQETIAKLSAEIPKESAVYLDGLSPAFYYLCDFRSVRLNRLGYTFPGYFYPATVVGLMDPPSYLVLSAGAFPSYRKLVAGFAQKKVVIGQETFYIIKKQ